MKLRKEVKVIFIAGVVLIMTALLIVRLKRSEVKKDDDFVQTPGPKPEPEVKPEPEPEPLPEETNSIVKNPESITMLVNKERFLAADFIPSLAEFPNGYAVSMGYEARPEVVAAYIEMVDAMEAEVGLWMYVTSAYRGYDFQKELYDGYVELHGEDYAKRMVAYPGTSEHQTGLVVDVVTPGGDMFAFGETEQSQWVNKNAHRFGFVIRYELEFEDITGYMAEAWHLRYLGLDVARSVYESGRPFDEYHAKYLD